MRHVVAADGERGGLLSRAVGEGQPGQSVAGQVQLQARPRAVPEGEDRPSLDRAEQALPLGFRPDDDQRVVAPDRGAQPRLAAGAVELEQRGPVRFHRERAPHPARLVVERDRRESARVAPGEHAAQPPRAVDQVHLRRRDHAGRPLRLRRAGHREVRRRAARERRGQQRAERPEALARPFLLQHVVLPCSGFLPDRRGPYQRRGVAGPPLL